MGVTLFLSSKNEAAGLSSSLFDLQYFPGAQKNVQVVLQTLTTHDRDRKGFDLHILNLFFSKEGYPSLLRPATRCAVGRRLCTHDRLACLLLGSAFAHGKAAMDRPTDWRARTRRKPR